jgi:hypothetical protein
MAATRKLSGYSIPRDVGIFANVKLGMVNHMQPNYKQLAFRDPALAASLGIDIGGSRHFGGEGGRGGSRPAQIGAEFGTDAATGAHTTGGRELVLEPNKNSHVKIQRYAMAILMGTVTLGTPVALSGFQNPQTKFRPQRVTVNAPEPGFAEIASIQVANVNVLVGGSFDAFDFNANGQDQGLDLPTITPANQITATGSYLGDLAGRTGTYNIRMSLKGPANLVA